MPSFPLRYESRFEIKKEIVAASIATTSGNM